MIIVYFVVFVLILIVGFFIMCAAFDDMAPESDIGQVRYIAIFTFASWLVAFLWPVLLVSALPLLLIYGFVVTVRSIIHKDIDY